MRIGHGYDVHKLVSKEEYLEIYPKRQEPKFKLAGVEIQHDKYLLGHSDADVVLHALCDALLGALAKGDIGQHFPDTDEKFVAIDSMLLLKDVKGLLEDFKIANIDLTVLAQKPKLAPHVTKMRENFASCLEIDIEQVNVKATTTEGLGFVGREEGIACHAVCLLN